MIETGEVLEVFDNLVKVRIYRKSACSGNCKNCAGCSSGENIITARNIANSKQGDRVEILMPTGRVLRAAVLVYVIPVLFLIFGYFLSEMFTDSDLLRAISGFLIMAGYYFILHIYDKKNPKKYMSDAIRVIE